MIISRYITREVVNALSAITMILLLAFLSQQIVRYLNYAAIGKIPTNILLQLVSFEIPYLLAFLLPLGLYLGIILAFGRLYVDNEMSIFQLYGFDQKRLFRLTATLALFVAGVVSLLMLSLNPWISSKRQYLMNSDEATIHLVKTLVPGRFQVSPDGEHVMYVEKLSHGDHAQNIFLAQQKKSKDPALEKVWSLVSAAEGYQTVDTLSKEPLFVLKNGYRYEGIPGKNDYKITQFKDYFIRIPQTKIHISHEENEALSLKQLWQDYANPKRAAELQWRISISLSALLLALLAFPLSVLRPRQSRYFSLLPAILFYIVYIDLLFVARHWLEQGQVNVELGMWWVHGIMLIIIVWLIRARCDLLKLF